MYSCFLSGRTSLFGGISPNQGYVKVYEDDAWIDVCNDRWWDMTDASVTCRSLGMKGPTSIDSDFESGEQTTLNSKDVDNRKGLWFLRCRDSDKSLLDCPVLFRWRRQCRNRAKLVCIQGT